LGIDYKTSGKNVTAGWIEVNCPFCSDPSYHLGISPTNLIHCWRCGEKGNVIKYLKEALNKNYYEIAALLQKHLDDYNTIRYIGNKRKPTQGEPGLSANTTKYMPKLAFEYLQKRGFEPYKISAKYKLRFFNHLGNFKFRIFIPVFENNEMVTFTTRDYSGYANVKYLHNKGVPIKHYLYNIDMAKENILIVEGVTDVWRMGDGAIATFGIEYTKEQLLKIARLGANKIIIMFDDEENAQKQAEKLAYEISPYCENVKTVYFHSSNSKAKDPVEWFKTNEEAERIKKKLFEEK